MSQINPRITEHMKKGLSYLLKQYQKMPGDKKIRIAMKLSQAVRVVRKAGIVATGA